jgi:hypothetical protein
LIWRVSENIRSRDGAQPQMEGAIEPALANQEFFRDA